MIEDIFINGNLRGVLAIIVTLGVLVFYGISLKMKEERIAEKLTQTLSTTVAIVITFYFVAEVSNPVNITGVP